MLTVYGQIGSADVIKFRILRWGDYPVSPKCNHRYPCKREVKGVLTQEEKQGNQSREI
jgi:hypothetical protein